MTPPAHSPLRITAVSGVHPAERLAEAVRCQQRGDWAGAAAACTTVLSLEAQNRVALQILGICEVQLGRPDAGVGYLERAAALAPADAVCLANLALACGQAGDWPRAVRHYRDAVALRPGHAASLAKLGRALSRTGDTTAAIEALTQAMRIAPNDADTCNAVGAALAQAGRLEEADTAFLHCLSLDPTHEEALANRLQLAQAWRERGQNAVRVEDWAAAAQAFQQETRIAPRDGEAHYNLGFALAACRKAVEARKAYEHAIELRPAHAEAWNNLAHVLLALGDAPGARAAAAKAVELAPRYVDARYNLGVILQSLGEAAEAASVYQELLSIEPRHADAQNNLGGIALGGNRLRAAINFFDRAMDVKAEHIDAAWNRGLAHLALGDWREGWKGYEARLRRPEYNRTFASPRWNGEPLEGKTIFLWSEQGLGDSIQFLRFVKVPEEMGAKVVVEAQPRLVPLLTTAGLNVIERGNPLPETDFQLPLLSLPGLLGITPERIPPPAPRYRVPSERHAQWRKLLEGRPGFRVGVTWGAQSANMAGRARSMPLAALEPLSHMPNVSWFSLQKGEQEGELDQCPWMHRVAEPVGDILDTAALIEQLDLVLTVDTMTAHLAGTMDARTWTLLPFSSDWRWMATGDADGEGPVHASAAPEGAPSAWYPRMRLFRQEEPGDWAGVVRHVQRALAHLL
jgi:Flp pilus assembly protein TadD